MNKTSDSRDFQDYLYNDIQQLQLKASSLPHAELEVRLGTFDKRFIPELSIVQFKRIIEYYKKHYRSQLNHSTTLDILMDDNIRVSINNLPAIDTYCKSGTITDITHISVIRKQSLQHLDQPQWYYRVNLASEDPIDDSVEIQNIVFHINTPNAPTMLFRFKQRYSFQINDHIRLDFTMVKSGQGNKLASTQLTDEQYLVEMEINPLASEAIVKQAVDVWHQVTKLYQDNLVIMSVNQRQQALVDYLRLIGAEENISAEEITVQNARYYFIGVDVLPLGIEHLIRDIDDNFHLRTGYSVTPKADGERYMAMFNGHGQLWLFNNRLEFKYSGFRSTSFKNTIVDGELVIDTLQGWNYLVFDCFWYQGQDVRSQPLWSKDSQQYRLHYVRQLANHKHLEQVVDGNISFQLTAKQYLFADEHNSILDLADQLYIVDRQKQLQTYGYYLDGLIFTPYNSPYPVKTPGTPIIWPDLLKWKPLHQLSIDFLVRWKGPTEPQQQVVDLLVTHKGQLVPFTPLDQDEPFQMTLEKQPSETVYHTLEGDPIYQDTVIECIYDKDGQRWMPLRFRPDKTELMSPNSFYTAMSTWKSISYPVTYKMITGQETAINQQAQRYYLQNKTIMSAIVQPLRDYNNIVKLLNLERGANLYRQVRNKRGLDLLDPACGRAGDLSKWASIRAKYVLGLDLSQGNLDHPIDGAKSRFAQWIRSYPQEAQFIWGNSQRLILTGNAGMNTASKNLLRTIMAQRGPNSFDLVSIQFALHYFTQSETTLRVFLANVSRNLRVGGYWVGTSFDGRLIYQALKNKETIAGYKVNNLFNKVKIWEIKRQWNKQVRQLLPVGQRITVYNINIGQPIDEYLVNYNYLRQLARSFKLELVELVPFKNLKDQVTRRLSHFAEKTRKKMLESIDNISPDEQRLIDFNVYFVFKKVDYLPKHLLELNESNAASISLDVIHNPVVKPVAKSVATPVAPKMVPKIKPKPIIVPKFSKKNR